MPLCATPRCQAAGPAPKRFRAAAHQHDLRCEVPQPPSAPGSAWTKQRLRLPGLRGPDPRLGLAAAAGRARAAVRGGAVLRGSGPALRVHAFSAPAVPGQRRNPSARLRDRGQNCGLKSSWTGSALQSFTRARALLARCFSAEIRGFSRKQGGLSRSGLAKCLSRCCRTQLNRGCPHCWASSMSPVHKPAWIALTCCHGKVAHLIAEVTAAMESTRLSLADPSERTCTDKKNLERI